MNTAASIISQLNPRYFWDVNIVLLDAQTASRLIIERVFNLGSLDEIHLVTSFYGREHVVSVLCSLNYIDPKTLNFITKFFKEPETRFRCHIRNQLKAQHWSS